MMNLDWQNILAPVIVALAALVLTVRSGVFSRSKKRTVRLGCWACMKCRKRPTAVQIEDKTNIP